MYPNAQQTFGGPSYPFSTSSTSSAWPDTSSLYPNPDCVDDARLQELWAPCNAQSAHEGVYSQPLIELDLGPELPDNYQNTVSFGSYEPLITHPSVSSVASSSTDVYDMSLRNSMSQQELTGHIYGSGGFTHNDIQNRPDVYAQPYLNHPAASFAYTPQAGGVASSHTTPSPQLPLNHPTPNPHHLPRRSPRTTSTSPYPSPSPELQQSGELTTYKRRNVQAPSAAAAVPSSSWTGPAQANKWQCPFCPHIQHNRRSPDFKRHLETHTHPEESPRWVCCGVPYSHARALGVPEEVVREEAFEFKGMYMVGGCKKTFSRRDALSRHLRKTVGECYGDAFAAYQPGNM